MATIVPTSPEPLPHWDRDEDLPSPSHPAIWTDHALQRLEERAPAPVPSPDRVWQKARFWGAAGEWGHRKNSYIWEAPGDLVLLSIPETGRWVILSVLPWGWFTRHTAEV